MYRKVSIGGRASLSQRETKLPGEPNPFLIPQLQRNVNEVAIFERISQSTRWGGQGDELEARVLQRVDDGQHRMLAAVERAVFEDDCDT